MGNSELAYLERRAAAEAELAQRATCAAAFRAHDEMSKAYSQNAEALKQLDQPAATQAA